jgi:hypothetical protein
LLIHARVCKGTASLMSQEMFSIHRRSVLSGRKRGRTQPPVKRTAQISGQEATHIDCRISFVCLSVYQLRVSYYSQISDNFLWDKIEQTLLVQYMGSVVTFTCQAPPCCISTRQTRETFNKCLCKRGREPAIFRNCQHIYK